MGSREPRSQSLLGNPECGKGEGEPPQEDLCCQEGGEEQRRGLRILTEVRARWLGVGGHRRQDMESCAGGASKINDVDL